jgi:hypothetical protein
MCKPCQAGPRNIALGKRSFAQYSTQALLDVGPDGHVVQQFTCFRHGEEDYEDDERASADVRYNMDTPVNKLVAAGVDLKEIKASICELTNDLHPLFNENNICACKHEDAEFCTETTYASVLELTKGTPGYLELSWAPPLENLVLRAMMQLATRIITHKDTLPFWTGIIKAAEDSEKHRYHVPLRRVDNAETALSDKKTLDRLVSIAGKVHFHFQAFQDLSHRIPDHGEKNQSGFCGPSSPYVEDPEFRLAELEALIAAADVKTPSFDMDQLEAIFEPEADKKDKKPKCDCGKRCTCVKCFCGWQDGKPITQDTVFPHIFLNLNHMAGYDMSNDDWQKFTISQLRSNIVAGAATICHEFTHAMIQLHFPNFDQVPPPQMNAEVVREDGFSFENYVFGGIVGGVPDHEGNNYRISIIPWPNYDYWESYANDGFMLELTDFSGAALPALIDYCPRTFRWECFLEQDFWDESEPRYNTFKKLWLRVHDVYYTDSTIAADETPVANTRDKRVRLSDAQMEYNRICARREERRERMQANKARWDRYCDKADERRESFLDNGGLRVFDEAWVKCTNHFDENIFL